MPLIHVLKVIAVAPITAWLEIARGKHNPAVWTGNAADVHRPRLLGKGCVNAGNEAAKERIPFVMRLESTLPNEPVRANQELRNGNRQKAVRTIKRLCMSSHELIVLGTDEAWWRWAKPKAFVVNREFLSARAASV
ncbi:MAG TPA: hypothetical protein VGM54_21205 [Chthoniobacter sp.]|jgi:hypothetical protein